MTSTQAADGPAAIVGARATTRTGSLTERGGRRVVETGTALAPVSGDEDATPGVRELADDDGNEVTASVSEGSHLRSHVRKL